MSCLIAAVFLVAGFRPTPVAADIGPTCPSIAPPRDERQAIDRAAFAFDGVVVDGRNLPGSAEGRLVSPLVFRVVRVVKSLARPGSYGRRSSAGDLLVTAWDATYYRPTTRGQALRPGGPLYFPDEIEASKGQTWRIYVDREGGVNFTATTCLGSHPLSAASATATPEAPVGLLVGLLLTLAVLVGGALLALHRSKGRRRT